MQKKFLCYRKNKNRKISPMRRIVCAFLLLILVGTILLLLPVSAKNGKATGLLTAMFTATSATCVTGLSVVETGLHWSSFGQAVILMLIQLGGLGFMSVVTAFFHLFGRRIGLRERMVIAQAYSLNEMKDVVSLLRRAVLWTLCAEAAGAAVLFLRFLGQMPAGRALWYGVFHSVSAFCNAGFDVLASVETGGSITGYTTDVVVSVTLMCLINLGGLGFFVWNEVLTQKVWRRFSAYTKLVLAVNGLLVVLGMIGFAVLEWNNAETIGSFSSGEKILASLFQSVTTRTAGFYSIPQGALSGASSALTQVLMFIGGASGSTAGGVKTVTFALVLLAAYGTVRGRSQITVFRRTVSNRQIRDANSIVILVFVLALFGAILLSAMNSVSIQDAMYECVSALGTVGLTTGITAGLNTVSKLLLIVYMFFGRVGIMTISLALLFGENAGERFHYAEEKFLIG